MFLSISFRVKNRSDSNVCAYFQTKPIQSFHLLIGSAVRCPVCYLTSHTASRGLISFLDSTGEPPKSHHLSARVHLRPVVSMLLLLGFKAAKNTHTHNNLCWTLTALCSARPGGSVRA